MKKTSKILTGFGLSILGIALIAGGGYLLKSRIDLFTHSILAEGIVIDIESSKRKSSTYYRPVISFHAADGNTYTFSSETGTSAALDFNKGDKIMVRYIEEKHQMARIDSFLDLWSFPIVLLLAGIVILSSGVGIAYKDFKQSNLRKE